MLVPGQSSPGSGKRLGLTKWLQGHYLHLPPRNVLVNVQKSLHTHSGQPHYISGASRGFFSAIKAQVTNHIQFLVYFSWFLLLVSKRHFILFVDGCSSKVLKLSWSLIGPCLPRCLPFHPIWSIHILQVYAFFYEILLHQGRKWENWRKGSWISYKSIKCTKIQECFRKNQFLLDQWNIKHSCGIARRLIF